MTRKSAIMANRRDNMELPECHGTIVRMSAVKYVQKILVEYLLKSVNIPLDGERPEAA
jgi:hypothetical protein